MTVTDVATPRKSGRSKRTRRIVGALISLVIVVAIFVYAIPQIADYSAVWATISSLTPVELWSLVGAMVFNLVTYWLLNMAALPGLKFAQSAVLTQTTTSVANTLPAGGAVAVGLTYSMLRSWGFGGQDIALYVGVTGIWNIFLKLGLPIISLALLAITGQANAALVLAALVGLAVLAVAVALFALALWKKELARRIGDRLGRIASALVRPFGRPPITTWGEQAVAFRKRTIVLVARRWVAITLTTVVSHLALWFVLLPALPLTPGGLGVVELGYIGGLVAAGGSRPQVVAAVLLFRVLTYGVQIPIGGVTYLIWRARSGGGRGDDEEAGSGAPP